ncbi:helix-turn-helix domain-containing protein [Helicobacter himalayensis]|uniref:helix-turn-helix domain-containing protein n=1 Tax=Helicobacter himalayensis TaxID=1591088 RepID=UPI003D6E6029
MRKEKGLSQLELSLAIGYKSVSLVAGAEAGYKNIHFNLEHLYKIAQVLEVDIKELF